MDRLGAGPAPEPTPAPTLVIAEPPAAAVRDPGARSGAGRRRRAASPDAAAVRLTVDLEPDLHRRLSLWALERRCDRTEVVRTLLQLLDEDDVVEASVLDRLQSSTPVRTRPAAPTPERAPAAHPGRRDLAR